MRCLIYLFICALPRICRGALGTCQLLICNLALIEVPAQSERQNRDEAMTAIRQEDSPACLVKSGKGGFEIRSEDGKRLPRSRRK